MKIRDYTDLIRNLPLEQHSFAVNANVWREKTDTPVVERICGSAKEIHLSRGEIYSSSDLHDLLVKTLMWGYMCGLAI